MLSKLFEKISLKQVSYAVMIYMMLAFSWWTYHLWCQSDRLFDSQNELLELRLQKKGEGLNMTKMEQTDEYRTIFQEHLRSHRMVLGEGLFFLGCLIFGIWIMRRSANRETTLARQRRNFMLSITHELKSPIASVRLVLETMQKRTLQKEQIDMLCTNGIKDATRLQNLVEDLLLAARLEDNWRPLTEPIDLGAVARECAARLKVRFGKTDFLIHTPSDLPRVQADKSGITSVIHNLLENAAKYSPENSTIVFDAEKSGTKVRFTISDQGQGIPEAERKSVFEKFYRLGNEETRKATGTGLGLYIVQQVVKAHEGTIVLTNNKPQGTIFTIEL